MQKAATALVALCALVVGLRKVDDLNTKGEKRVILFNLSGHGFYQFSPELFFNLYQAKNGFELLGIWFAMKADPGHWWKVADPAAVRHRVTLRNAHEVYMLVLAKKLAEIGPLPPPQQSDYAKSEWLRPGATAVTANPDDTIRDGYVQLAAGRA